MFLLLLGVPSVNDLAYGQAPPRGGLTITPSLSLSARYDSNVFFAPPELVPEGREQWDFSGTVAPQVEIRNKGRQVDAGIVAGFNGVAFVNNPELDFVSTNVAADVNLDKWIGEFIRGARLQVSDSFLFTPEPPAFLTGGKPDTSTPVTSLSGGDVFLRGIQSVRANTYTNTGAISAGYTLSPTLSLQGAYTHSMFRVGQIFVQPGQTGIPVVFFNTTAQTVTVGPSLRLTRQDNVSANYEFDRYSFSGLGQQLSVSAQTIFAQYSRQTSDWSATVDAGAGLISGGNPFFSGRLNVSAPLDPSTNIRLRLSRAVAPTFFVTASAIIANTVTLSVDRRLSKRLTVLASGNYAYNETAPAKIVKYESIAGSIEFRYKLTRTTAVSATYSYNSFKFENFGQEIPLIDRSSVVLMLNTTWK